MIQSVPADVKELPVQSRLLSLERLALPETVGSTQVLHYLAIALLHAQFTPKMRQFTVRGFLIPHRQAACGRLAVLPDHKVTSGTLASPDISATEMRSTFPIHRTKS